MCPNTDLHAPSAMDSGWLEITSLRFPLSRPKLGSWHHLAIAWWISSSGSGSDTWTCLCHYNNDINMSRCHFPNHLNWIIMQLQHDNRPPCHVISILPTPTPTPTCIWVREWAVIGNFVVKTQHCLVVCGIPVLAAACIVLDSGTVKPCDGLVGYHMSFGIFAASAPWIC